jgi:hypothetical protein
MQNIMIIISTSCAKLTSTSQGYSQPLKSLYFLTNVLSRQRRTNTQDAHPNKSEDHAQILIVRQV